MLPECQITLLLCPLSDGHLTLLQNEYSHNNVKLALRPSKPKTKKRVEEKHITKAYRPYVGGTTDESVIERKKHKIEITCIAHKKISNILRGTKT